MVERRCPGKGVRHPGVVPPTRRVRPPIPANRVSRRRRVKGPLRRARRLRPRADHTAIASNQRLDETNRVQASPSPLTRRQRPSLSLPPRPLRYTPARHSTFAGPASIIPLIAARAPDIRPRHGSDDFTLTFSLDSGLSLVPWEVSIHVLKDVFRRGCSYSSVDRALLCRSAWRRVRQRLRMPRRDQRESVSLLALRSPIFRAQCVRCLAVQRSNRGPRSWPRASQVHLDGL